MRVTDGAIEVQLWESGIVEDRRVRKAETELLIPSHSTGELVPQHHPSVIGQSRVIKQVRLNDPVHLQVFEMVRDALIKALADVSILLLRTLPAVVHCATAL